MFDSNVIRLVYYLNYFCAGFVDGKYTALHCIRTGESVNGTFHFSSSVIRTNGVRVWSKSMLGPR